MQHLHDGQIAEWIDAAGGPAGGPAESAVVRHLAECAVCRERVEQARAIAGQARTILGSAAPVVDAVPPFEEVLHRAGRARVRRAGVGAMRWLAWAATLVIAGGIGWLARDQLGTSAVRNQPAPMATQRTSADSAVADLAAPASGRVALSEPAAAAEEAPAASHNEQKTQAEPPAPAPATTGGGVGAVRQQSAEADRLATEQRRDQAAAAPPAVSAFAAQAQERAAPRREPASPVTVPMAKGAVAAQVQSAVPDESAWVTTSREAAEQALGGPIAAVEGLPVISYRVRVAAPVEVLTVQSLGNGIELELRQWRVAREEEQPAPASTAPPVGDRFRAAAVVPVDTVQVNGFVIVGRAPIPADSLRALLQRIK